MLDGYTETGSLANLTVGHRTINDLEERFDLTLAEVHSVAPGRTIETRARFGGLSYQRLGSDTIDVTLLGQQLSFATPGQRDVSGGYSSFGMSMHMQDGLSFFFDGEGYLMNDRSRIAIGKGGLRHTF